jgi:hypothetical protein
MFFFEKFILFIHHQPEAAAAGRRHSGLKLLGHCGICPALRLAPAAAEISGSHDSNRPLKLESSSTVITPSESSLRLSPGLLA